VTPAPTGSAEPVDSAAPLCRLLSPAWQNRARFVVLDGEFDGGRHFLECWQAWQHDANPCDRLHVISVSQQFALDPDCAHPLAGAVRDAWPTLTPNIHRLSFEDGRVQWLLVPLGLSAALRELVAEIDAFWLSRSDWAGARGCTFDPRLAKALARLAWNEQLQPFAALGLGRGEPLAQPVNEGRSHGAAAGAGAAHRLLRHDIARAGSVCARHGCCPNAAQRGGA
jgi:hypothetical protein